MVAGASEGPWKLVLPPVRQEQPQGQGGQEHGEGCSRGGIRAGSVHRGAGGPAAQPATCIVHVPEGSEVTAPRPPSVREGHHSPQPSDPQGEPSPSRGGDCRTCLVRVLLNPRERRNQVWGLEADSASRLFVLRVWSSGSMRAAKDGPSSELPTWSWYGRPQSARGEHWSSTVTQLPSPRTPCRL